MNPLPLFDDRDFLNRATREVVNRAERGVHLPPRQPKPRPPKTIREAVARRDEGIEAGLAHADRVRAEWRKWAYDYLKGLIALQTAPFLVEDLIDKARVEVIWSPPPDARSYGGIIRRLAHDRVIEKCGAAPARTSNLSLKPLWRRVESADEAVIVNKP